MMRGLLRGGRIPSESVAELVGICDEIDDSLLNHAFAEVQRIYNDLGADDQAAKGPKLLDRLTKRLLKLSFTGRLGT